MLMQEWDVNRVFVVFDNTVFRAGIEQLLDRVAEIEVVGLQADLQAVVTPISRLEPDVVLLDQDR